MSELLPITGSVYQGSSVGPGMFLVYISDLTTLCKNNSLIKFADDWCCLDRGPGSFDVEDATTLSWSSAAVSE